MVLVKSRFGTMYCSSSDSTQSSFFLIVPSPARNLSADINASIAIISWVEPENPNGVVNYTVSIVGVSLTTDAEILNEMLVATNTSESIDIQPHSNYTVVVTSRTGAGEGDPVSINFQTPEESECFMFIAKFLQFQPEVQQKFLATNQELLLNFGLELKKLPR